MITSPFGRSVKTAESYKNKGFYCLSKTLHEIESGLNRSEPDQKKLFEKSLDCFFYAYTMMNGVFISRILIGGKISSPAKDKMLGILDKGYKLSIGSVMQLHRVLYEECKDYDTNLTNNPANDLIKVFQDDTLLKDIEDRIPQLRNNLLGHGFTVADPDEYTPALKEVLDLLSRLVKKLQVLHDYSFLTIDNSKISNGKISCEVNIYDGYTDKTQYAECTILKDSNRFDDSHVFMAKSNLLKSGPNIEYEKALYSLDPFIVLTRIPKSQQKEFYFFEGASSFRQFNSSKKKKIKGKQLLQLLDTLELTKPPNKDMTKPRLIIEQTLSANARKIPFFTGFLGRESELSELKAAISKRRFLVIEGIAGIGKSFLASKLAYEELKEKDYNVVWVDCTQGMSTKQLVETVSSFCLEHFKMTEFSRTLENPNAIKTFLPYLQENRVIIVLDDFHLIFPTMEEHPEILFEYQEFFQLYKEMTTGLNIIITTRQMIPIRLSTYMGTINEFDLQIEGLILEDFTKYIGNINLDIDSDLIKRIHRRLEGHPKLLDLFCTLVQHNGYYPEEILKDTMAYEQEELQGWLLDNVFDGLNKYEDSLVTNLSQLKGDFSYSHARKYVIIKATKGRDPTDRTIKNLLNKFIIRKADNMFYRIHHIIKEYCTGKLIKEGSYEDTHRSLGYHLLPNPNKAIKIQSLKSLKYEIFDSLYHFFQAQEYNIAGKILDLNTSELSVLGMYREIQLAYLSLEPYYEFNPETEIEALFTFYNTHAMNFEEFKNRLEKARDRCDKIRTKPSDSLKLANSLELDLAALEFDFEKVHSTFEQKLVNEKNWDSNDYHNWIVIFININDIKKALKVHNLIKERHSRKRVFDPGFSLDYWKCSMMLHGWLSIDEIELKVNIKNSIVLAKRLQKDRLIFLYGFVLEKFRDDDELMRYVDLNEAKELANTSDNLQLTEYIENYEFQDSEKESDTKAALIQRYINRFENMKKRLWQPPLYHLKTLSMELRIATMKYRTDRNTEGFLDVTNKYTNLTKFTSNFNLPNRFLETSQMYLINSVETAEEDMYDFALDISKTFLNWLENTDEFFPVETSKIISILRLMNLKNSYDEMKQVLDIVWSKHREIGILVLDVIQENEDDDTPSSTTSRSLEASAFTLPLSFKVLNFSEFLDAVNIKDYENDKDSEKIDKSKI